MPENDQTRWIGIRPINPSENIPTTTRKLPPAISDLQAIKAPYAEIRSADNKDCSVTYTKGMTFVPAGELWVVTAVHIVNITSMCDYYLQVLTTAGLLNIKVLFSVPAYQGLSWDGLLVLEEGDCMSGTFKLGGVTDDVRLYGYGYKIGVY